MSFLCSGVIQLRLGPSVFSSRQEGACRSKLGPDQAQVLGHGDKSLPSLSGSSSWKAICWLCPGPAPPPIPSLAFSCLTRAC